MSTFKRSAAPAAAVEAAMPGDGTEDSLEGTIWILRIIAVLTLLEAGRELFMGGWGSGPYSGLLGLAGLPLLGALAALALGTRVERPTGGVAVAAGFGLITMGFLLDLRVNNGTLFSSVLGRGLDVAGAIILSYFVFAAVRVRRGLSESRFSKARFVLAGILVTYTAATGWPAGALHLAVAGFLVWQIVTPIADAYASLRERIGGNAAPADEMLEEFVPVAVHLRFTPEQQEIVDGIIDFISATYAEKWPNPTVREAVEAPAFTTYVLDKPDVVDSGKFISQVDNLSIKLGVSEIGLDISVSGKKRGLLIQIAKPRDKRDILWFDEFTARHGAPPPDKPFRVVIGEDSFGQPVYTDVTANDPHLLICGTTGSGKTIMMHNILGQMLENNSPDDLQLAVIDPKMVSGALYAQAGAPHLWAPVVIDADQVPELMRRVEVEMTARYKRFAEAHVTNRAGYNRVHPEEKIPTLIFLIDEVASLTGDEGIHNVFEKSVGAIAMKGRGAGVYLILGVQRPSQRNLSENVRGMLSQRIVFKCGAPNESSLALGSGKDDPAATRLGGSGDGYYILSGERVRFIGAYLPEEEDRKWQAMAKADLEAARKGLAADRANGAAPDMIAVDESDVATLEDRYKRGLTVASQIARIIEKWGTREIPQDLGPAPIDPLVMAASRAQLSAEHNDQCSDREWLVITGLRMVLANESDPYENIIFTPEALEPFVSRAAEAYNYREGDIAATEIHKTLGRFFPTRDGSPPRLREWPFNRAMIEPSKYDLGLVGRYAANPAAIPGLAGVATTPANDGPSVEDIAARDRRDY